MPLPTINESIMYQKLLLPSGKNINIRGWKVKEEKELLFASEKLEDNDIEKAKLIAKFLKSCIEDKTIADNLSETDLKKLAIELRKISKGDEVEYTAVCTAEKCKFKEDDVMKLSSVEMIKMFDLSPLNVNDDLILAFKDISLDQSIELRKRFEKEPAKLIFYYLINSIEAVTFKGETYLNFTEKEMEEFIDQLNPNDLNKIYNEFEKKISSVKIVKRNVCKKCGSESIIEIEDVLGFLIL